MQAGSVTSLSPSFNSYSNTRFADIAARVVREFDDPNEFYFEGHNKSNEEEQQIDSDSDSEFEFAFVNTSEPPSADEIFQNGQIRPVYPVFNRDLVFGYPKVSRLPDSDSSKDQKIRLPLRTLFNEERESALTTSYSGGGDDLAGVPEESYCVWRPEAAELRKKSSSTGSNSKRWNKFKDLLSRSHSDGSSTSSSSSNKDTFVFFTKKETAGTVKLPAFNGGEKRRSYLPYRQDLVGIFGNVKWTE